MAVPGITGPAPRRVAFIVAEVIVHLRAQRPLDYPPGRLADKPVRAVQQRNAGLFRVGDHPVDRLVAHRAGKPLRRRFIIRQHNRAQARRLNSVGDDFLRFLELVLIHGQ
jgi:hypothetical protein